MRINVSNAPAGALTNCQECQQRPVRRRQVTPALLITPDPLPHGIIYTEPVTMTVQLSSSCVTNILLPPLPPVRLRRPTSRSQDAPEQRGRGG